MFRAIALAASLFLPGQLFAREDYKFTDNTVFVGTDFDQIYTVTITPRDLEKTPAWDRAKVDPPLSARQALKLATEFRNGFVKDAPDWKWKLTSIGLRHPLSGASAQKWFWVAYYQEWPLHDGFGTGMPPDLYVVVLMDGSIVKPVVKNRR